MSKTVKVALIVGGLGIIGVIITVTTNIYIANIPIHATQRAEARAQQTQDAAQTLTVSLAESPTPVITNVVSGTPYIASTPMAGEDISRGCIWDHYWKLYPSDPSVQTNGADCWILRDKWGIYAGDGNLNFTIPNSTQNFPFTIYSLLPAYNNIEISFDLTITNLSTKNINSDLFFGIGNPEEALSSGQFIIYRVIPNSSTYYVAYNTKLEGDPIHYSSPYNQGEKNSIVFSINGLILNVNITPYVGDTPSDSLKVVKNLSIVSTDRIAFWIGYSLRTGANLQAYLSAPCITPCKTP